LTRRTSETDPLQIAEVSAGAGVVGITLCPGKQGDSVFGAGWARDLEADIEVIRSWGAAAVVTLIEDHEFDLLGVEALPAAVTAAGIEWHHLPITDVSVPDQRFELRWPLAWSRLRPRLATGERVLVHCRGGLGRAGMIASRLLVEFGAAPEVAIATVRTARPGAIETAAQETWVRTAVPGHGGADESALRRLACLVGGAIGDALGYRVEFQRWPEIKREYGATGIRLAAADGVLEVSDDTQMTLFTLEGMARARDVGAISGEIRASYLDWLDTQRRSGGGRELRGRLAAHAALRHARAPGTTCLAALRAGGSGTIEAPINHSKGCGGVMRTAPLGFLSEAVDDATVFRLGAEAAAVTHGHPEGYLPAGAMAVLVRDALNGVAWEYSITKLLRLLQSWPASAVTASAIEAAVDAAAAGAPSRERLSALGEGWVGEEALAVGLYCALTAQSFAECIELAANHDGDSDSTASIAGQLWGARYGLGVLPSDAVYRLDALEPLLEVWGEYRREEKQ
jgi:ADP-ribosylglycohydrolase/protein-tyrosine phosphatase